MRKKNLLAAGALSVVLALGGCAPSAPESPGNAGGSFDDTLTVATTTDVVNYNPLIGNSRSDYWITNLMYPHLLSIADNGKKIAGLATDWATPTRLPASMRSATTSHGATERH